jgi:hypothetical protein
MAADLEKVAGMISGCIGDGAHTYDEYANILTQTPTKIELFTITLVKSVIFGAICQNSPLQGEF